MSKPPVLVLCQLGDAALRAMDERFAVIPDARLDDGSHPGVRGLIVRSGIGVGDDLMARFPDLEFVVRAGSGSDNIDLAAAARRGVAVRRNAGASAGAVAELALASLLALARRLPEGMALARLGVWGKARLVGEPAGGLAVAVWGGGVVGQACGRLLAGCCAAVRFAAWPSLPAELPAGPAEDLPGWADAHVVCLPLRESTRRFVGPAFLRRARARRPYLVNVARYDVLDNAAVAAALLRGELRGVAIDPIDRDHLDDAVACFRLREVAANVQLTPHLGAQRADVMDQVGLWAVGEARSLLART
jgi:D-3-phosphoglycerate dehydrogenase / 2-oxoglutarate reductase